MLTNDDEFNLKVTGKIEIIKIEKIENNFIVTLNKDIP